MSKKSKKRNKEVNKEEIKAHKEIPEQVEEKFKSLLRIMSWTVGICFLVIIVLPNFEFILLDIIIKVVYYIGVFNLLLFIFLELFGTNVKRLMSKYIL